MGYTHYWRLRGDHPGAKWLRYYADALRDIRRIVRSAPPGLLAGAYGTGEPALADFVAFNGNAATGDDHETFSLAEEPMAEGASDFCKTAQKPYDVYVTACLAVLAEVPGFCVTSDGEAEDWYAGIELASKVLGHTVTVPTHVVDPEYPEPE